MAINPSLVFYGCKAVLPHMNAAGQLVVVEMMPSVKRNDVIEQTGFKVIFHADCTEITPLMDEELFVLRYHVDPMDMRRLEFVGSRDRGGLLDDMLE